METEESGGIDAPFGCHSPPHTVPGEVRCATLMEHLVELLQFQMIWIIWSLFMGSSCMSIVGNYKAFGSCARPKIVGAAIIAMKLQTQDDKFVSLMKTCASLLGTFLRFGPAGLTENDQRCKPVSDGSQQQGERTDVIQANKIFSTRLQ